MVAVQSTMMKLGTPAPNFALPDTEGNVVKRDDFRGRGRPLLVMFICNHCPFVKHVAKQLKAIGDDYAGKVDVVAIMANDVEAYPDDAPRKMKQERAQRGYRFPYLYDSTQRVAQAYTAACTPDFFLFDPAHKLVYRGQLDDTRPARISSGHYDSENSPATGADLRAALDAALAGKTPAEKQMPSMGCNIKWKPGNEPEYFNA